MSGNFTDLTVAELLALDCRPTFVVELGRATNAASSPLTTLVVYRNPALLRDAVLSANIPEPTRTLDADIWQWLIPAEAPGAASSKLRIGLCWTRTVLQNRWVVVSANAQVQPSSDQNPMSPLPTPPQEATDFLPSSIMADAQSTPEADPQLKPGQKEVQLPPTNLVQLGTSPDHAKAYQTEPVGHGWTWEALTLGMPQGPFLNALQSKDWAATPLGHPCTWSPRLQQAVHGILVDPRCSAIYWGSAYTSIYNEAFSDLCGKRHPGTLGVSVDQLWPDKGAYLMEKMQKSVHMKSFGCCEDNEWPVSLQSVDGRLCEAYVKSTLMPIAEDGKAVGFVHSLVETTSAQLWERRSRMLLDIGDSLAGTRTVKAYWRMLMEQLQSAKPEYDVPLAILYSVTSKVAQRSWWSPKFDTSRVCYLEASLGVPRGHPIAPTMLNLKTSTDGLSAGLNMCVRELKPVLLSSDDGSLPTHLLEGLEWRGFGEPCRQIIVFPITPTKENDVMGILALGINPRRPYDGEYRKFTRLLDQKLAASLASVVLLEEARYGNKVAKKPALDQFSIGKMYERAEVSEFFKRFESVAQFLPIGVCFGDDLGNIDFANDAWFRITGVQQKSPDDGHSSMEDLIAVALEEDRQAIRRAFKSLQGGKSVTFEFRVKRAGPMPDEDEQTTLMVGFESPSFEKAGLDLVGLGDTRACLASAKPEMSSKTGKVVRILTCLTDVTLHKRTAEEAVRRAQQAENLKRMAEFATVGMYDMDLDGRLLGANRVFYEMCGMENVADPEADGVCIKPFHKCVLPEDLHALEATISRLVAEGKIQSAEMRFKNAWSIDDEETGVRVVAPRWVLATFMPVRDAEGVVRSFTGCLSDVSLQKWQLERERQRKEDAIESKRQQESFIDMTSHEMRNPLSAIVHCADAVIASLSRYQRIQQRTLSDVTNARPGYRITGEQASGYLPPDEDENVESLRGSALADAGSFASSTNRRQLLQNGIDNAETIILCAQHQKRIVDDILTMSKLDSKLLVVTPVTADPVLIVKESLKMFEVEARRVDIELKMVVDKSFQDLGVEFLNFDPSRVKQVLINLLTNALKFTTGSGPNRTVSVALSASKTRPDEKASGVEFIPREEAPQETTGEECSDGQNQETSEMEPSRGPIYILFQVKDTGQGLNEQEKKVLFQRFVQASSRTHVKYGGSGLGLFISRRLTEMQNGAIGVASSPGVGSTFAFYIAATLPGESALAEARSSAGHSATTGASVDLREKTRATKSDRPPLIATRTPEVSIEDIGVKGILVVEDNLINQQITRRMLGDRGYVVDVANHGLEALEKLCMSSRFVGEEAAAEPAANLVQGISASNHNGITAAAVTAAVSSPPSAPSVAGLGTGQQQKFELDVILMDIEMPIQDGLACTREIRELERQGKIRTRADLGTSHLPIIAVSANARMEQILEAKAAGCDDVLVKPYRMPELMEKMGIVVNRLRTGPVAGGEAGDSLS